MVEHIGIGCGARSTLDAGSSGGAIRRRVTRGSLDAAGVGGVHPRWQVLGETWPNPAGVSGLQRYVDIGYVSSQFSNS